jgi:hypothetical protein
MNWLQKLICAHQWAQTYSYASLSLFDSSGTITTGQRCSLCQKERTRWIKYRADGSVEKEVI